MKKKGLMWLRTPNSVTKVQDGTHRTNKTTLEEGDLLTRQDKATLAIKHEKKRDSCGFEPLIQ